MEPIEFLKEIHDGESIISYYEEEQMNGNFLERYSPKFYSNQDFLSEIIMSIVMTHLYRKSVNNLKEE